MEISTEPIEALPSTFVDALAAAWVQEGPAARRRLVEAIDGAHLLPDDMVLVSGWAVIATNLAAAVGQEDTQPYRVLRASRAMGRTIALAESGEMVLEEVLQQFWARLSDIYAECAEQHGVGLLPAIRGTRTLALVAARSSAQALEAFREQRLAMAGRPADRLVRRLVGERREPRAAERAAAALGLEAGPLWVTVGRPPEGVQLGASDARAPRLVPAGPRAQTVLAGRLLVVSGARPAGHGGLICATAAASGPTDLPRAFAEASLVLEALPPGVAAGIRDSVDVAPAVLLRPGSATGWFLRERRGRLDDLAPELREAAEAWAASGGVASGAAEVLNASETTVRRRVTRVGQLLDLDLESLGGFCALRTLLVASATSMS